MANYKADPIGDKFRKLLIRESTQMHEATMTVDQVYQHIVDVINKAQAAGDVRPINGWEDQISSKMIDAVYKNLKSITTADTDPATSWKRDEAVFSVLEPAKLIKSAQGFRG